VRNPAQLSNRAKFEFAGTLEPPGLGQDMTSAVQVETSVKHRMREVEVKPTEER
ncbi:hypothetical protein BaRGS_00001538, partial [Batillaria attramentaria]